MSQSYRKYIWQTLTQLQDQNTQQTRNRRELTQPDKGHLGKHTEWQKTESSFPKIRSKTKKSGLAACIQHCTGGFYTGKLGKKKK